MTFKLDPGDYVLHEVSSPDSTCYKTSADIPFSIDVEGIHKVGKQKVSYVEMVDEPAYKVVFHENKPSGTAEEKAKEFKVYGPGDIKDDGYKIKHFYDIPSWAGDEYVFAGWYYDDDNNFAANASAADTAVNFETQTYPKTSQENPQDYHLYAKWIKVGTVAKQTTGTKTDDNDYGKTPIRGFGLAGVQVRNKDMYDSNYSQNSTDYTSAGMRFVTSFSESLYNSIDNLSSSKVETAEGNVDVEYGYVVGAERDIKTCADKDHYNVSDLTGYKLQYKGENVNGVNTTGASKTFSDDFRYVTNVNCTRGTSNSMGTIKDDHRNFDNYRLYTLVVTYDGASASHKDDKISARSYIRYYDANGKLRVFYNEYKPNLYYGGCLCSYNQISSFLLGKDSAEQEES